MFTGSVEHAIAHIEESIQGMVDDQYLRWYAIKVFERDEKVLESLTLTKDLEAHLEAHIADCENELEDDAESIITNQRYAYINLRGQQGSKKEGPQAQPDHLRQDRPDRDQPRPGPAHLRGSDVSDLCHRHGRLGHSPSAPPPLTSPTTPSSVSGCPASLTASCSTPAASLWWPTGCTA